MGGVSGTGMSSKLSRPPDSVPSHVYRPTYRNYTSPYNIAVDRAITGSGGLADTPQAKMYNSYAPQMPTFNRPEMAPPPTSGGFGRFPMQALSPQPAYRIPSGQSVPQSGSIFGRKPAIDPNLAAINQVFAPRQAQYDSDGNPYNAPVYMDESRRDAILADPGKYLEYAQYVQGGGDPSKFTRQAQPIQYMTQGQRDALTKSQANQLSSLLPQAAPTSSDG